MATVDMERQLAAIRSEIGYRLGVELDRSQGTIPSRLERLVRALDDAAPMARSPSIVPDINSADRAS